MDAIIQIIAAGLGTLGFAMLFHLRPALLGQAAFCGMLAWTAYYLIMKETGSVAFSAFLSTAVATFYAERLAESRKVPATLFVLPAALPLIPGGPLYYTMRAVVNANAAEAWFHGVRTLQFALGIAGGIIIASACGLVLQNISRRSRKSLRDRRVRRRLTVTRES